MEWCFSLKKKVEIIDPSDNLALAYLEKSKDSLEMADLAIANGKKEWAITAMYYCQYLALYALFQKIGIKSENHTCTILIAEKYLPQVERKFIVQLKNFKAERIEKQYYVAKSDLDLLDIGAFNKQTKELYTYFLDLNNTFSFDAIMAIRKNILGCIEEHKKSRDRKIKPKLKKRL